MNGPTPLDGPFRARCAALARRLAARLRKGAADGGRSPAEGRVEFREHRPYVPGDDLRDIDWNALARLDMWVTKARSRDEAPELLLIIDRSGSMGPTGSDQDRIAVQWAFAAGFLACVAGGRVVLSVPGDDGRQKLHFRGQGTGAIPSWVRAMETLPAPAGRGSALALRDWATSGPGLAALVITDGLGVEPVASLASRLGGLPNGGTIGLVMAHPSLPMKGRGRIAGMEGEIELACDDLERLAPFVEEERLHHVETMTQACRRHGARIVVATPHDVVERLVTSWVLGGKIS